MFKKLKDKITEEVKSSPQRLQQFTQSVSDRLQNSTTSDENFFSIGDDDANMSSPSLESGFSTVNLTSPDEGGRMRRNSNCSIASDVSFLPRYESSTSMYHLQSDLDISASEVEDNASSSSQLGHLSKEQIYAAFQKAQLRYHKYRGRFTDLVKHYKELERDNAKMKSVLVETQDKAIRRVAELKEQCGLEQKAKAHLENALRVELDEKQYKIDVLQTKIDLLQKGDVKQSNKAGELLMEAFEGDVKENLDTLTKDLNGAREEIESLNGKLQEMKANSIVFQSKESDYRTKIANLEKQLSEVSERERENSLKLAESKMELHNEINSKDAEISRLKGDLENLKHEGEVVAKNTKLDNLQSQNKKLIEKVETLTQKCANYESDMLKMEQYKIEMENLNTNMAALKENVSEMACEKQKLEADVAGYKLQLSKMSELQGQLGECQNNLQRALKDNQDLLDRFEALQNEHDEIVRQKQKLKAELSRIPELERQLSDCKNQLERAFKDNQELLDCNAQQTSKTVSNEKMLEAQISKLEIQMSESKSKMEDALKDNQDLLGRYEELKRDHDDVVAQNASLLKLKESYEDLTRDNLSLKNLLTEQKLVFENKITQHQDDAKKSLLQLENKIKNKLKGEFARKEAAIKAEFDEKLNNVATNSDSLKETHVKLLEKEDRVKQLQCELVEMTAKHERALAGYGELEKNHLELIEEGATQRNEISSLNKELAKVKSSLDSCTNELAIAKEERAQLSEDAKRLEAETADYGIVKVSLAKSLKEIENLQSELDLLRDNNTQKSLKEVEDLRIQLDSLQQKNALISAENEKLLALEKQLQELTNRLSESTNQNEQLAATNCILYEQIRSFENKMVELEADKSRLKEQLTVATEMFERKLGAAMGIEEENQRLKGELEDALNRVQSVLNESNEALVNKDSTIMSLQKDLETTQTDLQTKENAIKCFEEDLKTKLTELQAKEKSMRSLEIELETKQAELQVAKDTLETLLRDEAALREQMAALKEYESKHALILDENHNLKEQLSQIETLQNKLGELESSGNNQLKELERLSTIEKQNEALSREVGELKRINSTLSECENKNKRLQQKLGELSSIKDDYLRLEEKNKQLTDEFDNVKTQLQAVLSDKNSLQGDLLRLKGLEKRHNDSIAENDRLKSDCAKLHEELAELKLRNGQISADNKLAADENHALLGELEEIKIKLECVEMDKTHRVESNSQVERERDELTKTCGELTKTCDELQRDVRRLQEENELLRNSRPDQNGLSEKTREYDELQFTCGELSSELKSLKSEYHELKSKYDELSALSKQQQLQLSELENHTTELLHEKQLLQDEVHELKIAPINSSNSTKLDNLNILKCQPDETKYAEEITRLRDKVTKYKSLDLTNRSSIEFYEGELQKLRNKNDKLNRKLDETLVTLNHCAELSNSTEIEYLRNVLYNYMLGKEGLVLARVIAAVCKFDQQQTELVLQKEQQKQTLLGQLGIL